MTEPPTPDELVQARDIVNRLAHAIPLDGSDAEAELRFALVEAKRQIAIATSWLGDDPAYAAAWERMVEAQG